MIRPKTLLPGQKIRALIVDDSVVIRRLVTNALEDDPELEVVGVAAHGGIALQRIPQVNPDVVTLDIEMPEMDGLETLRQIRRHHPNLRVVMFSTLTERGGQHTLEALALGADDYVTKASNEGSLDRSMARLRDELIPKVKQFFLRPGATRTPASAAKAAFGVTPSLPGNDTANGRLSGKLPAPTSSSTNPLVAATPFRPSARLAPIETLRALTIGVSTGGPNALGQLLPTIPADFPLPILLVQHMPALLTPLLAERLNQICAVTVLEAEHDTLARPGHVYIAPGNSHMRAKAEGRGLRLLLDDGAPINSCRPAVDALWLSLAEVVGAQFRALILTGMGQDGLRGASSLKALGSQLIAQDEASSVVWGMPGAVVQAGLADVTLPLEEIAKVAWR
ncbi:MAG: chemotaxis response regulator protein-glutamate methylesterase [Bryobacterales bacterium]|nr:chemotaxis response regulator protein-glutamate methylesterase [Bryobacterales bacterium]